MKTSLHVRRLGSLFYSTSMMGFGNELNQAFCLLGKKYLPDTETLQSYSASCFNFVYYKNAPFESFVSLICHQPTRPKLIWGSTSPTLIPLFYNIRQKNMNDSAIETLEKDTRTWQAYSILDNFLFLYKSLFEANFSRKGKCKWHEGCIRRVHTTE